MPGITTRVWEITGPDSYTELLLLDRSSLDAISSQLPEGLYSTFRTYEQGTKVVGLSAHLDRLYAPPGVSSWGPICTVDALRYRLHLLLKEYQPRETRVRISLHSQSGYLNIAMQPLIPPPPDVYEQGVLVVTTNAHREEPSLKRTVFILESRKARVLIAGKSAYEGLIVNKGRILEGLTSNFFYVKSGRLGTAGRGVLAGVTRGEILRLAREELAFKPKYRALRMAEVPLIEEAFICSSSREIVPIVQVDELVLGSGKPGDLTRSLMHAYHLSVLQRAESII